MFVCACKSSVDLWVVVDIKWWRHRVMQLQLPQQQLKRISSSHRRSTQRFEVTDNPLRPFRCRVPNYHNNVSARLPVPVAITQWQHYGGKIEGLLLPKNPLPLGRRWECGTWNAVQEMRHKTAGVENVKHENAAQSCGDWMYTGHENERKRKRTESCSCENKQFVYTWVTRQQGQLSTRLYVSFNRTRRLTFRQDTDVTSTFMNFLCT